MLTKGCELWSAAESVELFLFNAAKMISVLLMCFDFYVLQQRRYGLMFAGGGLMLLSVFGRHVSG